MAKTPASAGAARKAPAKPKGLTTAAKAEIQRARFVEEYLVDMNATQAAIRAGYTARSAPGTASRLLKNAKVSEAIATAMKARSEKAKTDADWLLERLRAEADADIAECFDKTTGLPKPVHEWPLLFRQGLVAGLDLEHMPGEDAGDEDGKVAKQPGLRLKIRFTDRTALKGLIGKHTNVRAFERSITLKPDVDALQEFAKLIQGRSIKPMGAK